MATENKHWAQEYVSGPLHEPTPAEETGLNTSFQPDRTTSKSNGQTQITTQTTGSSIETNPFRRGRTGTASSNGSGGLLSASPTTPKSGTTVQTRAVSSDSRLRSGSGSGSNSNSKNPFYATESPTSPRRSGSLRHDRSGPPPASLNHGIANRPRRSSSLREQFPGDPSVHPLEQLTKEQNRANRSPHLKKKHHHGSDSIDKLDSSFFGPYHHEGPYDAASLARNNTKSAYAPIGALKNSNNEALKATPREAINDSLERHRPLDNVAVVPSGQRDAMGREYRYKEGLEEDMMRNGNPDGGAYKRWAGVDYHPDDLKGKGEPSFTIEKGLKEHSNSHSRTTSNGASASARAQGEDPAAVELVDRSRAKHSYAGHDDAGIQGTTGGFDAGEVREAAASSSHKRDGSTGSLNGLKKRIGSLRRKDKSGLE